MKQMNLRPRTTACIQHVLRCQANESETFVHPARDLSIQKLRIAQIAPTIELAQHMV
jgi:hypothetical protein